WWSGGGGGRGACPSGGGGQMLRRGGGGGPWVLHRARPPSDRERILAGEQADQHRQRGQGADERQGCEGTEEITQRERGGHGGKGGGDHRLAPPARACRMDRARSAAIAWRRKIGRAAPSVAGGCLPPTARGAQGSRQPRGAEAVWHLLPGRPDTQPSTGSCSQERVHGTGFAGPRDHGRLPCGVGVTASALATGVLYAVPTVVWGA